MNLRSCSICGGDSAQDLSSLHGTHFYHQGCLSLYIEEGFILDCNDCFVAFLENTESDTGTCIRCFKHSDNFEIIRFCQDCQSVTNLIYHLKTSQKFVCSYCKKIKNMKNPEDFSEKPSRILCFDCRKNKSCNSCPNPLDSQGHLCNCGTCLDSICFKNYEDPIPDCEFCKYIYESKFNQIRDSFEIICNNCKRIINCSNITHPCLNFNYYCESCLGIPEIFEKSFSCKCLNCENIKEIKRSSKKCVKCGKYNRGYELSKCQKFLVCQECISQSLRSFTDLLCTCIIEGCKFCLGTMKNKLKSCAQCHIKTFVLKTITCEYLKFYCESCLKDESKFRNVIKKCSCKHCLHLFRYYNQEFHRIQSIIQDEIVSGSSIEVQRCSSSDLTFVNLNFLQDPTCSNCKENSDFALICNHNQCFLCIIKVNLDLFYDFLRNIKSKKFTSISNKFQVKCCSENCDYRFDMPLSAMSDVQDFLFKKEDFLIFDEFTPYLEGLNFQFSLCKCRLDSKVIAFNHELKLGCYKCG